MTIPVFIMEGTEASLPFFETFETMNLCQSGAGFTCGDFCSLDNGWQNVNGDDQTDWRVHQGETLTSETGPIQDQNTGQSQGHYLYIEGSGGCTNKAAQLLSPCIDLGNTPMPVLTFWYHLYGEDIAYLHVDLFDGQQWYFNIIAPLIGNQGNLWQKAEVNLQAFSGTTVLLRFEGKTGDGYQADMALDNIAVLDAEKPPVSAFHADVQQTCVGERIQLFDNSYNTPTSRLWQITPSSFIFVEGTNAFSKNPVVRFQEAGPYQVSLQTENSFGTDTKVSTNGFFDISNGVALPFVETFEDTDLPLDKWELQNPDDQITWALTGVIGTNGEQNTAVFVNNHSYNATGEQDVVTSDIINLGVADHPELRFDVSYAQYNEDYSDELRVLLSTDCGMTFDEVIYQKSGANLSTANNATFGWEPSDQNHWRTEIVSLEAYQNQSIAIKFVNTNGYGNNLYLDNIRIADQKEFPYAFFDLNLFNEVACVGETLRLFVQSGGTYISHFWEYDLSGWEGEQVGIGMHTIPLNQAGVGTVKLKVCNSLGCSQFEQQFDILESPDAFFEAIEDQGSLVFDNQSISDGTTSYFWEFGDGQTSTEAQPVHTYEENKSYDVRLTVTNACGSATYTATYGITTHIINPTLEANIQVYPNPVKDLLSIEYAPHLDLQSMSLFHTNGQLVQRYEASLDSRVQLDVSQLSAGVYLIQFQQEAGTYTHRFVKQ